MAGRVLYGDCRQTLRSLPDGVARCCVTSPPYWGLRDYGHADQIGLESTPEEYVETLVAVFREVRRCLADDGTLWLNLGDSYAGAGKGQSNSGGGKRGMKPKDLVGIPWRVAFALQADGWWLRSDIIWHKPNPMPENVTDRPTSAHEHVFLLTKSEQYFYDAAAIAEPSTQPSRQRKDRVGGASHAERGQHSAGGVVSGYTTRNARNVWTICSKPYSGAHFATMPPALASRCIAAGSEPGDVVIDPFLGSGTTAQQAEAAGRDWIGCEVQEEYRPLIQQRTAQVGLFRGDA